MMRSLPSISTTGPGGALEHPEVGHEVVLASRLQLLQPLVAAGLFEEIDGGGHIRWRAVSVEVSPVALAQRTGANSSICRSACMLPRTPGFPR